MRRERRILSVLIAACLLVTFGAIASPPAFAAEEQWVLVEVQDNPNDAYWANSNKSPVYEHTYSYGRGTYSAKFIYEGETDNYYKPPYVNGESLAIQAQWTLPPVTIKKDQTISLKGSISVKENTQSAFKGSGSTSAWLGNTRLKTADGKTSFDTSYNNQYAAQSGTVTTALGQGSPGQKKVIELNFMFTNTMWTKFIYEWSSTKKPISITEGAPISPVRPTPAVPARDKEPPPSAESNYKTTGIKVSDLHGEVLIRRGDKEDSWELLEPDSVIYEGDHIKTEDDSGVILAMGDMTTFQLKPESELIVTLPNSKDSKLRLVAGTVYMNLKKMMTTGLMEVEMSQAVAGIKGTTFVLEEKKGESILKVLEGSVTLIAKKSGASKTVKAGTQAAVTSSGLILVTSLDIRKEAASWNKTIVEMTLGNKVMLVNGVKSDVDPGKTTAPRLVAGKIVAPINGYAAAFGITRQYEPKSGEITLKRNKISLTLQMGKKTAVLNGTAKTLSTAPSLINGSPVLPLEEVSRLLGLETQWKPAEKKIIIQ